MEKVPDNYENIGVIMSNYDNEIVENAEEILRTKQVYGEYTAWNFWAAVWFADGVFKCMVKQYRSHVSTFSRPSLREIMNEACERYGSA